MFARVVAFTTVAVLSGTAVAASETYSVDSGHTYPSFEISHLGFSTQRGRFDKTSGRVTLDRQAKTASVEIAIDTNSIDTGNEKLEEHLRKPDFFDVAQYPTITFKSSKAHFNGDTLASLDGNLTLHGQTKPVTLSVTRFNCATHPMTKKPACGADAVTTIKRSDFGMKYGIPVIGDDVKLLINIEAMQE
ncbi:MAG: YceI family protein [Sulfurifustis sp.]